jgi:hypothetical protein
MPHPYTYIRADRPLPLGRFVALISVRRCVDSRTTVRLEGLGELKNPMTSGIEPALPSGLSTVPQLTMLPRAPLQSRCNL